MTDFQKSTSELTPSEHIEALNVVYPQGIQQKAGSGWVGKGRKIKDDAEKRLPSSVYAKNRRLTDEE